MPPTDKPTPDDPLLAAFWARREGLRRMFVARTRDEAEADDLVQELFIRLTRTPAGPVSNPEAYLYRLAINLLVDNRRQRSRQQRRDGEWSQLQTLHHDAAAGVAGETTIERRQRIERLARAIDELPPKTRQAFQLHKLEGLTHAEVGRRMGISKSAVEKHIMRALKRLLSLSDEQ